MTVGRRQMTLGSLGLGVAVATDPRMGSARETEGPQPLSTYGVLPGGGIDQTARLQEAADGGSEVRHAPFSFGPGFTRRVGSLSNPAPHVQGVAGKSIPPLSRRRRDPERYLRDVSVTYNLIHESHIGIGVSSAPAAGTALIIDNLITGAKDGAIRAMHGAKPIGPDPRQGLPQPRDLRQRRALASANTSQSGAARGSWAGGQPHRRDRCRRFRQRH
jgi:hypothetical protein